MSLDHTRCCVEGGSCYLLVVAHVEESSKYMPDPVEPSSTPESALPSSFQQWAVRMDVAAVRGMNEPSQHGWPVWGGQA